VVVPAHNEVRTISGTLESLERLDYPPERYEVFVVADNCVDSTAEVARKFRCTAWERTDPWRRAKGFALSWAFERIPVKYDAVVVVDADTKVDSALLAEFARAYQPSTALQALSLQVSDSGAASATSYVASALQNGLKWGRENLGCSVGLGGTGMCIPRTLLEAVRWERSGLAEDAEYHADLVLAGRRVRFVPEARVEATAPGTLRGLQSQRSRWERGRTDALSNFAGRLLRRAVQEQDARALEVLAAMAMPSFSLTVSAAAGCIALGVLRRSTVGTAVGTLGLLASAGATLRALWLVQAPTRVYAYSLVLPVFVVWRTYISLMSHLRGAGRDWVRTERSGERG
jgi:cellulose synthase/poly-beta-1,6-N-acetylglucosamine synthase-like glycosyltransferase